MLKNVPLRYLSLRLAGLLLSLSVACSPVSADDNDSPELTYLALGDSYTIGEAVESSERWPDQLVQQLGLKQVKLQAPHIIAKSGWTTDELLAAIQEQKPKSNYDVVTLLIGVNNQYRGRDVEEYRSEFEQLLKMS